MNVEQLKLTQYTNLGGTAAGPIIGEAIGQFTATFGLVDALLGKRFTVNVPGLKVSDTPIVNCISLPPLGMCIANCRVSAPDTLEILITTSIALGLTLGSLDFRVIAFQTA